MITLYGIAASRTNRCLWMLEELGLPYRHEPIYRWPHRTAKGSSDTPEFLALNPSGKVPLLTDTDGDVVMSEAYAINLYLAQRYSRGAFWPDSGWAAEARQLQWSFWAANEVDRAIEPLILQFCFIPPEKRDTGAIAAASARLDKLCAYLDGHLEGLDFILDGRPTVADVTAAGVLTSAFVTEYDLWRFPNVGRWFDAMTARPAWKTVMDMGAMPDRLFG